MEKSDKFLSNSSLDSDLEAVDLRNKILELVKKYTEISHKKDRFVSGKLVDEHGAAAVAH